MNGMNLFYVNILYLCIFIHLLLKLEIFNDAEKYFIEIENPKGSLLECIPDCRLAGCTW